MRKRAYITLVFMLLLGGMSNVMAQGRNSLIIADDRLILLIDLKSTPKQLDSILNVAGISKANTEKVFHGDFNVLKDDGWSYSEKKNDLIRFERSLADLSNNPQSRPYRITAQIRNLNDNPGYPTSVNYGVNKFAKITVYELASGLTRFILPGYERSKRAFLSGNFNEWSTLKGLMKRVDGGWLLDVKLEAGACEYKFITDGRWTTDPDNLIQTNDGAGNVNSVYYKYNYTFKLPGYPSAHKVTVAGEFNNWNADALILEKKGTTWQLQMYLNEGKHLYYFMVDGRRITDPLNLHKENNEAGYLSSVLNIGETVTFKLDGYLTAKKVTVSGSFNNWDENALQMKRIANGWALPETFPAGNYSYRFIVDGISITDPHNPLTVFEKGELKSFVALKPTRYFVLKGYGSAKKITLHGSFNDWEPHGYTMVRKGDDWIIGFNLKPGKYLYKFIIDGRWILDPGNKFWEQNQYGTGNSVLWIE
jgi:Glycogen recognition site of AMP-activated protein kinase/Carbohydrate-binding module 48 (Isoamylase N-terminal domain)